MAFSTIRRATDEDYERLAASWKRFCKRHASGAVHLDPDTDLIGVIQCTYGEDVSHLESLWQRAARRALRTAGPIDIGHPLAIAHGHVGTSGW